MPSFASVIKNPLYKFLLSAAGFYLLWYFLYNLWLRPADTLDLWVVRETMSTARHILNFMGFVTFSYEARLVGIDGTPGLWMGDNCDSIELCAIFTGFIIAFPGLWKHKLWYIPLGWVLITYMNVMRIVALAITQKYLSLKWLNFNHTYTFTIIAYAFIFMLWYVWINKTSKSGSFRTTRTQA
jgi:exosortase/archaeosortase family protein